MACKLCEVRKPRRYCPGVNGEICPQCCGNERERTVDCPLDCPYLVESRVHEKLPDIDENQIPYRDLPIKEEFVEKHAPLITMLAQAMFGAWLETPSIVDNDIKEALDAMARTYKTRESGLIYDTHPSNPYADAIVARLQGAVQEFERRAREVTGMTVLRDADVLGVTVFLQRVEFSHNNGKPRGRAFLSFLAQSFPPAEQESSLIQA